MLLPLLLSLLLSASAGEEKTRSIKSNRVIPAGENDLNLTDRERRLSENYINDAHINKVMEEECAKLKDSAACRGQGRSQFLGIDSAIMNGIAKAYGTFSGVMSVKGSEGGTDYCGLIGAGAEIVGIAMQEATSRRLTGGDGNTSQKQLLYKAADSHKSRAKTSGIQAVGWGGTAACYGYKLKTQAIKPEPMNIVKVGAAGLLAAYHLSQVSQHNKYAKQVRAIADKLPGKGDCNPITETSCYCSLDEHANDPKYCVPGLHQNAVAPGNLRVSCVDEKLRSDPKCNCVKSNSCLDKLLLADTGVSGIGKNFLNSPEGRDALLLNRGELKSEFLSGSTRRGKSAGLDNLFNRIKGSIPPPAKPLSPQQQQQMEAMAAMGVPRPMGALLASRPPAPHLRHKAAGGFAPRGRRTSLRKKRGSGRVLTFGGRGLQKKKARASRADGPDLRKLMARGRKSPSKKPSVLRFQKRALSSAQLTRDSHKNIFEIISKRYMLSAKSRLETP